MSAVLGQVGERRRNGEGHDQRGQNGEDIGDAEWCKQSALDSRKREHRQENQRHDEGGVDDGTAHLNRRVEDDAEELRSAFGGRGLAQAAKDILDIDDGVVDDLPNGDSQPSQGECVEALPEVVQ